MYLELKDFNEGETQENICMTIPGSNYVLLGAICDNIR